MNSAKRGRRHTLNGDILIREKVITKIELLKKCLESRESNVDKSETACHREKKSQKSGDFHHNN